MTIRACAYLRVSGESQVEKDGFPRQRECIAKRIEQYKVTDLKEFVEEAESGDLLDEDRPALGNLLVHLVNNHDIKLVFIERVDRFSRKLLTQELVIKKFFDLGVTVIGAESDIDLTVLDDDPGRILIRQIFGAFAQFEKSSIVRKLKAARLRKKKENGRCEGVYPFGEHPKKPLEAIAVQMIVKLRSEGKQPLSIADSLNAFGSRRRNGELWDLRSVLRQLGRLRKMTLQPT